MECLKTERKYVKYGSADYHSRILESYEVWMPELRVGCSDMTANFSLPSGVGSKHIA